MKKQKQQNGKRNGRNDFSKKNEQFKSKPHNKGFYSDERGRVKMPILTTSESKSEKGVNATYSHVSPIRNQKNQSKKGHDSRSGGKIIEGVISINARGIGYVSAEHLKDDVEIQPELLARALDGDTVEVVVSGKKFGRTQGRVKKVLHVNKNRFVGTIYKNPSEGFKFVADDRKLYPQVILKNVPGEIADSTKVIISLEQWVDELSFEATISDILGKKGNNSVEMFSILVDKGFAPHHPRSVLEEAKRLEERETKITETEVSKRRDFRKVPTFTIDPADAKDFDDAISFQKLPNGLYEIGVHIADVSHYVRENSELDAEARDRQFSVYLVDRTIPMLPEVLSNNLCSLNPNEDKLTFSAVFEVDAKGAVSKRWFGKTIIHSCRRYSYEEAQQEIVSGVGDWPKELQTLNLISKELRQKRFDAGAVDFEQDEVKFVLDALGKPLKVIRKIRFDAHKLVEEFMLLANREVATYFYRNTSLKSAKPFLYRVHDLPNKEKIENLALFAKAFGHTIPLNKKVTSKDIQALIQSVEGKVEEGIIKTATVRSMAKAVYATKNIGHFGLAFEYYAHFTSPIRRYPDLVVHRLLYKLLNGEELRAEDMKKFDDIAEHATEKEIAAAKAERESIKYKQVEYMMDKIGQEFDGIISGVTEWGLFVEELETRSDGMVRVRDLPGDYYELNEKQYALIGKKTKKKYSLGDKVRFKLVGADLERKSLDYSLVDSDLK